MQIRLTQSPHLTRTMRVAVVWCIPMHATIDQTYFREKLVLSCLKRTYGEQGCKFDDAPCSICELSDSCVI
jgi:hypothetical protein